MKIRMMRSDTTAICAAALTLDASHFVVQDGWDEQGNVPIWAVYDMATARKGEPFRGEWSINDPIRTFACPDPAPAVMFALTKRGSNDG